MDKQKSNNKVYFIKVASDEEETKKKKTININYNNTFHQNFQKKTNNYFKKKANINENNNNNIEKFKQKTSSGHIHEDSSPTKETMNSPSYNNNNNCNSSKKKDKNKEKNKIKNNKYIKQDINVKILKETPKRKYYSKEKYNEEKNKTKNKSKKSESIESESIKKNDNEDDLVTSFERKPSELKSPHTVSEDSFTSSLYEEEKEKTKTKVNYKNDKQDSNEKKKNHLSSNKDKDKESHNTYSELVDNELIYVDKINIDKDDNDNENEEEEEENDIDKNVKEVNKNILKSNKKNLKNPEIVEKEKKLSEKELKEMERDKKKEKFKNIEIKTKTTTRQTIYVNNLDKNRLNYNNNKIIVNKSPRDYMTKTERETSSSNFNNVINLSKNNDKTFEDKIPYIPVNQRKKLTVNKKIIDFYNIKDKKKTNSLNYAESNIAGNELLKKNDKEKLVLSINKNGDRKIFGITKTNNTEEKNRYRRKYYMYGNQAKDNDNKINNRYNNKGSISNRKQKDTKNNYDNKIFKNTSHTIHISNDYNNSNNIKNNENTEIYPSKNSVLMTKKKNNKFGLSIDDTYVNKYKYLKQLGINTITKKNTFNSSSNKIIYEPKKLGVIRVRSTEKVGIPPLYSNMSYDPNQYLNTKIKDTLSSVSHNLKNIKNKNSEDFQNDQNDLNNSFSRVDTNNNNNNSNQSYNVGQLNNTMVNNKINSFLNSSYDLGKIEKLRNKTNKNNNNSNIYLNNTINHNNALLLSKMAEKSNGVSSFTNLFSQNERYSLHSHSRYGRAREKVKDKNKETPQNTNNIINNNNIIYTNNNIPQNLLFHNNSSYDIGLNDQMKNIRNQTQLINLIGNNFLGPNIVQNNTPNPANTINNTLVDLNNINLQNLLQNNFYGNNLERNSKNSFSINFEDLIILQEFLREIIIALNKNKVIENECFEFWNYYYNSSICCQLEKLFINPLDSNAVRISINYTLMSIMLCYDYSFEHDLLNKSYNILGDILKLSYKNLILICEHILSKISKESLSNIWVLKLSTIVNASNFNDYNQFFMNEYNMSIVEKISYNTNIIVQNLRFLLKNYKSNKNDILTSMFKKIREKTYEEINIFFRENILRVTNIKGSILGSVFLLKNTNFRTLPSPYVRTKNNKEFSLVLDLDETLIHFKPRNNGEEGGILRVRPGINEFLDEVGKYYELIIFTTATQDYADILIDAVEEDKIYFDHRLYREHAIIIDNDFVKDLTRIGRPLDKTIIVDNMPQNFRLQKENGIIIKAFWGEDNYDTALYDLIPILVNIAKEGGDVRKSLLKYKDEIIKNVTSCISKVNI